MSTKGAVQDTPSPQRSPHIDRDPTPERGERTRSYAASPTASRHSESRSHRRDDDDRRSSRRHGRDTDEDEEEARRRRKRRDRERQEEEDEEDPEERRRRRADRKERERLEELDRDSRRESRSARPDDRKRDRSTDSGRRSQSDRDRSSRSERDTRDREREYRDRDLRREREREEQYGRSDRDRRDRRGGRDDREMNRSPPRRRRRQSPSYDQSAASGADALFDEIDQEARSVFVSQIAAKLTSRDLGAFFEDMLGEGSVRDARIVTDRVSRKSKGIGYVELSDIALVEKALKLSETIVMGIPIKVELTEAERNKLAAGTTPHNLTVNPQGLPLSGPGSLPPLMVGGQQVPGQRGPGLNRDRHADAEVPYHRLYVGNLNFELTAEDVKQVFMPFGELEFVDLHRDSMTGKSKGFCFVQFVELEPAKTALQTMNGFELASRQLRVSTVNEKASSTNPRPAEPHQPFVQSGPAVPMAQDGNRPESLDDNHGQRLDHAARQALMMKLARQDAPAQPAIHPSRLPMVAGARPPIPVMPSNYVLVNNMFSPEEETERDWDTDLADDIKGECEAKYGPVVAIKVEKESQGEVYIQFASPDVAAKAVMGLNGRFFGGRSLVANYLPEPLFRAHVSV